LFSVKIFTNFARQSSANFTEDNTFHGSGMRPGVKCGSADLWICGF